MEKPFGGALSFPERSNKGFTLDAFPQVLCLRPPPHLRQVLPEDARQLPRPDGDVLQPQQEPQRRHRDRQRHLRLLLRGGQEDGQQRQRQQQQRATAAGRIDFGAVAAEGQEDEEEARRVAVQQVRPRRILYLSLAALAGIFCNSLRKAYSK